MHGMHMMETFAKNAIYLIVLNVMMIDLDVKDVKMDMDIIVISENAKYVKQVTVRYATEELHLSVLNVMKALVKMENSALNAQFIANHAKMIIQNVKNALKDTDQLL